MNEPTHLAAGMFVAQTGIAVVERCHRGPVFIAVVVGCVLLIAVSHLALDAIPHYNWIVYLNWFRGWPLHGFIREAVLAMPIVALAFYCGRHHPILVGASLLASIYPDIEKFVYCDLHGPEWLVIFRNHSLQFSAHNGGLSRPKLISIELVLVLALVLATIAVAKWRRKRPGRTTERSAP